MKKKGSLDFNRFIAKGYNNFSKCAEQWKKEPKMFGEKSKRNINYIMKMTWIK
jgi:hypothetical protein